MPDEIKKELGVALEIGMAFRISDIYRTYRTCFKNKRLYD